MKIGGIVENPDLTLYRLNSLRDAPGEAGSALNNLSRLGINFEYITESACKDGRAILAFCVKKEDNQKVDKFIEAENKGQNLIGFEKSEAVCVVGIYGPHFREKSAVAATFFKVLGEAEVNILGISSSISSVCCVLSDNHRSIALEAINKFYDLP